MQRVTWLLQEFSPSSAENVLDCDLVPCSVLSLETVQLCFFPWYIYLAWYALQSSWSWANLKQWESYQQLYVKLAPVSDSLI